jgi:hypothetical protein
MQKMYDGWNGTACHRSWGRFIKMALMRYTDLLISNNKIILLPRDSLVESYDRVVTKSN